MTCITGGCNTAPKLGSFDCALHSRAGVNTLTSRHLPRFIDVASVPRPGSRAPAEREAELFGRACRFARVHVAAFLVDLKRDNCRARRAIEKVFGVAQVDDMKPFLGWLARTCARTKTWLLFSTHCTHAPISLPPPKVSTHEDLDAFSKTLIHKSAHGVRVKIKDRAGYRTFNPALFYRAAIPDRLVNADHYAACIALFRKWLKFSELNTAAAAHGVAGAVVAQPRLTGLVSDLSKVALHAKIQVDRQVINLKQAEGKALSGPDYVDFLNALGVTCDQGTLIGASMIERVVDIAHQLRRFDQLLHQVEVVNGDVTFIDRADLPEGMTEAELNKVGVLVFSNAAGAIHLGVGGAAGRAIGDAELRALLLKALLKHCLQHKQNAADVNRRLRAEQVAELYRVYCLPGPPAISIDLDSVKKIAT